MTGAAAGAHTVLVSINSAPPATPTSGQLATILASNITIAGANTATFNASAPPVGVTVAFAPQGGAVSPAQQPVTPGAAYGTLPVPARPGATFAGWFTAPAGGAQVTAATTVPAAAVNHILYARWLAGGHPVINPAAGNDLYGSILDDTGAPVPNVVVSDGFQCVKTDATGIYQMKRNAKARVVFYSTPETHAVNTLGAGQTGYAWFSQKLTPGVNRHNFDLVRHPAPETDFILLGIGDPQVTSLAQLKRYETETVADINKLRQATPAGLPIYGIMLGDIVGDNLHLHAPLRDIVNASPFTCFSVIGNHDHDQAFSNLKQDGTPGATITNNKDYESGETYENIYGPLNYSVNIGNTHIIGLDNVLYTKQDGYSTGLTAEILEWVRQDLSFVPKTKTIVIAYHIPLRGSTSYQNALNLFNLLKDYADVHFLAGHTHYQQNIIFNITGSTKTIAAYEHIHGGACGAWWNSIVNTEGAPNGYGVYTISGTKITDWYSHPTGYSDTYQMRMYRGNTAFGAGTVTYTYGKTANDVVVDVWNSDTTGNWKFAVYENDVLVSGSLTKLPVTRDAYAAGYHVGVLGRATPGNYDSINNNHLYLHTLRTTGTATRVEIRATDRFGKTYTLSDFTTDLSEFPNNFSSPAITAQPQNVAVTAGLPVSFAAAATGTPQPSLKWQTLTGSGTWTNIASATTATFAITAANAQMDGAQYRL
ncbi:MAG: calcineurin-like phosphoesterase C-terminal domain-containing protein, partial [Opitutaceae bacterium]|nr:calcineurin-like phosphoesterase C-terminal domain-containing protein [Opitutaceae bacterium]